MQQLSSDYSDIYDELLDAVGTSSRVTPNILTAFWPMRGHRFDGDLFVIGRVTNGWYEPWRKEEFTESTRRLAILKRTRKISESIHRCPLLWVIDRAGDPEYNSNDSAFWRVIKRVSLEGIRDWKRVETWPSWICWSNLLKVGPDSMQIRPSAALKRAQQIHGTRLIEHELSEFNPRRVLVLSGRDWFEPFAEGLGLQVKWRSGLVEGIATCNGRRWVIAKHPMKKPEDSFVDEVIDGFAGRLRM